MRVKTSVTKRILLPLAAVLIAAVMAACSTGEETPTETAGEEPAASGELTPVTLMLDWVPNTNHTGFFVAQNQGYFEEAGLDVEIVQPGEVLAEQAVSGGAAEFGVSFQEQLTLAYAGDPETNLVSIAAIIQHNTSGFASPAELGVESPADWEGLTYGSFSSLFEAPTLEQLMTCAGGDFSQLEMVDVGYSDPLALLDQGQIDLAWIFYGVQGFQAEQQGVGLDIVMMNEYFDCIPDYYTPVLITSSEMIDQQPEVVSAFVEAVARGYEFAIDNPDEAATILLDAVPELDEEQVRASQEWFASEYAADAPQWGYQTRERWEGYTNWMVDNGIIDAPIDIDAVFTTEFLPER